jgi:ATP-binding cassette subfamily A (ABC1) protein 3
MILTSIIYVITLWLCDTFIESNRGYRSQLWKKKTRKQSVYQMMSDDEEQPIVSIKNLQKTYGSDVFALRGISMDLKKGEIVGLLGENGAGKSTLINILIGALGKSSGDVRIDGKSIDDEIIGIRKFIGVCPQFDILWEEMTAAQHVEMFCRLKGFPST